MKTDEHGTGAIPHPNYKNRTIYSAEALGVAPPNFNAPTGLSEPPDEDQGSSSSCTSQADGYYIWALTGNELLREDSYSHTRLPGGGAYLNAPGNLHLNYGGLGRSDKYVEPSPETETNMSKQVLALDQQGRAHRYTFKIKNIQVDINTIGSVLEQYKGCIIGIHGNNAGWTNMTDPTFNGSAVWGHALYAYDRSVRSGKNAIKAKSSWCNSVKNHFINSDYFANGGVFEALVYDNFKEITMSQVKTVNIKGEEGILLAASDPAEFAALCKVFGKDPSQIDQTV